MYLIHAFELDVMPSRSAWSDGDRAFYLYKQVNGDFDVSMRLRVTGRDRDTLQDIIAKLKEKDFGIHMQFTNYRSN